MNVVYFDQQTGALHAVRWSKSIVDAKTCWKQPSPNQQRREVETKSTKHNGQQRYGTYLIKWREMLPDTKPQQWWQQPQPQQPQQQLPAPQWQQPSRAGSLSDPTPMQCSIASGAYAPTLYWY